MKRMGDNELGSILKGILKHDDGRYILCEVAELYSFKAGKQRVESFGRQEDERRAAELRDASLR